MHSAYIIFLVFILMAVVTEISANALGCKMACKKCRDKLEHPSIVTVYCEMCEECKAKRDQRLKMALRLDSTSTDMTPEKNQVDSVDEHTRPYPNLGPVDKLAQQPSRFSDVVEVDNLADCPTPPPCEPEIIKLTVRTTPSTTTTTTTTTTTPAPRRCPPAPRCVLRKTTPPCPPPPPMPIPMPPMPVYPCMQAPMPMYNFMPPVYAYPPPPPIPVQTPAPAPAPTPAPAPQAPSQRAATPEIVKLNALNAGSVGQQSQKWRSRKTALVNPPAKRGEYGNSFQMLWERPMSSSGRLWLMKMMNGDATATTAASQPEPNEYMSVYVGIPRDFNINDENGEKTASAENQDGA